jgi:hypothetical protein
MYIPSGVHNFLLLLSVYKLLWGHDNDNDNVGKPKACEGHTAYTQHICSQHSGAYKSSLQTIMSTKPFCVTRLMGCVTSPLL